MTMTPEMARQIWTAPVPESFTGSFTLHCHEGKVEKVVITEAHSRPAHLSVRKIVDSQR